MPQTTVQTSFIRGEVAPEIFGRVDTKAYQEAVSTARNVIVHAFGGISNRAGLLYLAPVKDHTQTTVLVPFRFKAEDTHILEFGHQYIRVMRNDQHVTETPIAIIAMTQANPVQVTTGVAHGLVTGDEVLLEAMTGMTELVNARALVTVIDATHVSLRDQASGANIDGTLFTAYVSGGTLARIFTLTTNYQASELFEIRYQQSADVMRLTHKNHDPMELSRLALNNWTLTVVDFKPSQAPPTNVTVSADTTGTVTTRYKVTATTSETLEESLPGLAASGALIIVGITQANPAIVTTSVAHGLPAAGEIEISSVVGMTELNGRRFRVFSVSSTQFELKDVDSTDFMPYVSGGTATPAFAKVTNGTAQFQNTITWAKADGVSTYSVYREENGFYGFIGDTEALSFTDGPTIQADLNFTPPQQRNPFFGEGNNPNAIGSHQQRQVFGGSDNAPDTSFFSRIGTRSNLSISDPLQDDDAITATLPASQEINRILHYVSAVGGLLVFTSGAEWLLTGSPDTGITPGSLQQELQSNWGSSNLRPITVSRRVLFNLPGSGGVRMLGFSFTSNVNQGGFESNNISLLVPHLFRNRHLLQWGFSRSPDPLIYAVRDDGEVLVLAFDEEQQVIAWSRWDTKGKFKSVATNPAFQGALSESAFFVVERSINGQTVKYIERVHNSTFTDVRDAFFVDSGLSLDSPSLIEAISLTNPVVLTITGHPFVDGDLIDIFDIVWTPTIDSFQNQIQPDQLNRKRFIVDSSTANTFALKDQDGATVDGSAFSAYVEGGTVRKAVTKLFGLRHLIGETVTALADGNVETGLVVAADGTVTLPRPFSRVHIGFPIISDIETLDIDTPVPERGVDRVTGKMKNIASLTVQFDRSRGMLVGPDAFDLVEMRQREFEDMGDPTSLFSGSKEIIMPPSWNTSGRIFIRQIHPLPMNILSISPVWEGG